MISNLPIDGIMTYLEVARKTYLENRTKYLYIELGIHPYENKEITLNTRWSVTKQVLSNIKVIWPNWLLNYQTPLQVSTSWLSRWPN